MMMNEKWIYQKEDVKAKLSKAEEKQRRSIDILKSKVNQEIGFALMNINLRKYSANSKQET